MNTELPHVDIVEAAAEQHSLVEERTHNCAPHSMGGLWVCVPAYYSPFAKVMFLYLSVSHSVHRGVCLSACWDTHPEQTPPPPRKQTPLCTVHAGRYGQQAGSMHPTGMQSCVSNCNSRGLLRKIECQWAIELQFLTFCVSYH